MEKDAYLEIPTDWIAARKARIPLVAYEFDTFDPRGLGRTRRFPADSIFFQWREVPSLPNHIILYEGVQRSRQGWAITRRDFERMQSVYAPSPVRQPAGQSLRERAVRLAAALPSDSAVRSALLSVLRKS